MKIAFAASLVAGSLLLVGPASAQGTAAPAPAANPSATMASPGATMKSSGTTMARSAKSKECSVEADKQGLHGKARKAFRNKCRHQG